MAPTPSHVARLLTGRATDASYALGWAVVRALPEGVAVREDRIFVDLRTMLERYHFAQYLEYVSELRVNTVEGAVVLAVRGHLS